VGWDLIFIYFPGQRVFKLIVTVYVVTIVQCTKAGIEELKLNAIWNIVCF
jgi:hypothetical protein